LLDLSGRITGVDRPSIEILKGDTSRSQHCTFANLDSRPYESVRRDPSSRADLDRLGNELKVRIVDIVTAGA
jgi:hypothetical protein